MQGFIMYQAGKAETWTRTPHPVPLKFSGEFNSAHPEFWWFSRGLIFGAAELITYKIHAIRWKMSTMIAKTYFQAIPFCLKSSYQISCILASAKGMFSEKQHWNSLLHLMFEDMDMRLYFLNPSPYGGSMGPLRKIARKLYIRPASGALIFS